MENLKDALEYAVELKDGQEKIVMGYDGKEWFDGRAHDLRELDPKRYPEPLRLSSLTSLVEYIKKQLDETKDINLIVHVKDHETVELKSELDETSRRTVFATALAITPDVSYGKFLSTEQFNIMLQSSFIANTDSELLLQYSSSIKIDKGAEILDNGVSQTTTIKNGVSSLVQAKTPNPVTLRPYRTFFEVEQPESKFVFRINDTPGCALIEADGGIWRAEAKDNIANYLHNNLTDEDSSALINRITILA
jgi:hypothetical protein